MDNEGFQARTPFPVEEQAGVEWMLRAILYSVGRPLTEDEIIAEWERGVSLFHSFAPEMPEAFIPLTFSDVTAATLWFEAVRWGDGFARCPTCDSEAGIRHIRNEDYTPRSRAAWDFRCDACLSRNGWAAGAALFNVRTGTVFYHSGTPLYQYARAIYLLSVYPQRLDRRTFAKIVGIKEHHSAPLILDRLSMIGDPILSRLKLKPPFLRDGRFKYPPPTKANDQTTDLVPPLRESTEATREGG